MLTIDTAHAILFAAPALRRRLELARRYALTEETTRRLGAIYTPPDLAQLLVSWAIQYPEQKVLDLGIGEGVFVFSAYRRLLEVGASAAEAQRQVYGAEVDSLTYKRFLEKAHALNADFPHLKAADFFEANFPLVDAIVGNPPYIRRTQIEEVDRIRQRVLAKNQLINGHTLSRLTDLYVYFLLYALAFLKQGGRLGVITADSWLNVGYGEYFKEYLLEHFEIEGLLSLDRRVFHDAEVRPVLILATRKQTTSLNKTVHFVRVRNNLPVYKLQHTWNTPEMDMADITRSRVKRSMLKVDKPWSIHFKTPVLYEELASHPLMTTVAHLAETRIGLQTLAKEFFILSRAQVKTAQIEDEFLEPLAVSSRYFCEPTIEKDGEPPFYLFYCSATKGELQGTNALKHILQGEAKEVSVRGKGISVIGYQNKERIKRSGRTPWYNLKSSLERRGRAQILIPRLMYRTFAVVWNKAGFVPGELFIEFMPFPLAESALEVYLAVLASSITEIMLRAHAQIYGGGTYNTKPGQIKKVPIMDVRQLTTGQKDELQQAYLEYLATGGLDRTTIDTVISDILDLGRDRRQKLGTVLQDLLQMATDTKKSHLDNPQAIQE
jgi:methylase of polypeptide subunit release factors